MNPVKPASCMTARVPVVAAQPALGTPEVAAAIRMPATGVVAPHNISSLPPLAWSARRFVNGGGEWLAARLHLRDDVDAFWWEKAHLKAFLADEIGIARDACAQFRRAEAKNAVDTLRTALGLLAIHQPDRARGQLETLMQRYPSAFGEELSFVLVRWGKVGHVAREFRDQVHAAVTRDHSTPGTLTARFELTKSERPADVNPAFEALCAAAVVNPIAVVHMRRLATKSINTPAAFVELTKLDASVHAADAHDGFISSATVLTDLALNFGNQRAADALTGLPVDPYLRAARFVTPMSEVAASRALWVLESAAQLGHAGAELALAPENWGDAPRPRKEFATDYLGLPTSYQLDMVIAEENNRNARSGGNLLSFAPRGHGSRRRMVSQLPG